MWFMERWFHQTWQNGYDEGFTRGYGLGLDADCPDCPFSEETEEEAQPPLQVHRELDQILREKTNER